jgi:hypothetical protein
MRVLDIFPYFNEKELLELRINLLKDKVDQFIICEANRTQTGIPKEFTANKIIQQLNLPLEKIKVIELDLSKYDNDKSDDISLIREREQRNIAKLYILPGDIAIVSDCDEIIDPKFIDYYCKLVLSNSNRLLRVPMIWLLNKVNLQVYDEFNNPRFWYSAFICSFEHLNYYSLSELRESYAFGINIKTKYENFIPLENNQIDPAGWHFSWMGKDLLTKYKAGFHSQEFIPNSINTYSNTSIEEFITNYIPTENSTDPLGRKDHILKLYDINLLPKLIFELPNVLNYLLPKIERFYQNENFGENWFTFPNLYNSMIERFPSNSRFVEVGSWKGRSSFFMCNSIIESKKDIEFFCVDTWQGSDEHKNSNQLEELYNIFLCNMKSVESYYFPLKLDSISASKKFKDKSLDFVFIDAAHDYKSVKNDILAWLPKIKDTGVLAGHDYYPNNIEWCGVYKAVNELFSKNIIKCTENCFIIEVSKLREI